MTDETKPPPPAHPPFPTQDVMPTQKLPDVAPFLPLSRPTAPLKSPNEDEPQEEEGRELGPDETNNHEARAIESNRRIP